MAETTQVTLLLLLNYRTTCNAYREVGFVFYQILHW